MFHRYSIPNGNNGRHNVSRSVELLSREESETPRVRAPSSRFKCLVWSFFAIITFFIAGAKYYFRTVSFLTLIFFEKQNLHYVLIFQRCFDVILMCLLG